MAARYANHFRLFDQVGIAAPLAPAVISYASEAVHLGRIPNAAHWIGMQANFTYAGADGGTLDVYLQTSLDGGLTWMDIANIHLLQATARRLTAASSTITLGAATWAAEDLAIAANTCRVGLIGDRIRIAVIANVTYATSRLVVDVLVR
jgi:hypothetical protein